MSLPALVPDVVEEETAAPRPLKAIHAWGPDAEIVETEVTVVRRVWRDRLPRLTPAAVAEMILLVLLALQCARLFWTLVTPLGPIGDWSAAPPRQPAPQAAAAAAPLDFDPFFRRAAETATVVVTSLPLTLHGTREDRATGRGSAIIGTPDGQQNSYVVGEQIMDGVTLAAVAFDSVTIERGGAREQIFLGAGAAAEASAPPGSPR
jgi:general secretion pathway protein C